MTVYWQRFEMQSGVGMRIKSHITHIMMLGALVPAMATPAPAQATVPGGNGKIAFYSAVTPCSGCGGVVDHIFVMDADGTNQTDLNSAMGDGFDPSWSPDGTKIVFVSTGTGPGQQIWVMNADGSNQTALTVGGDTSDEWPAWSPDGTKIAFDNAQGLWVMRADGSAVTQLDTNGTEPAWSPDGSKIAFAQAGQIWVMNADGSGPTQLTNDTCCDGSPSWSPDGSKIAFTNGAVWVINADGSRETDLNRNLAGFGPAWSPDGTKIAFESSRQITVMNADGSNPIAFSSLWQAFAPSWQPVPSADLALSLGASPNAVASGKQLTYAITVHDNGPSNASGVVVTDQLPPTVRFVSARQNAGSCITPAPGATGLIQCNLGFLADNKSLTDQIVVTVTAKKTTIDNTASVTSNTKDPNAANDSATMTTTVK